MANKTCFLITPIRNAGTEEYEHFRALRDTVIEPSLSTLGYDLLRADDVAQSGAITADIIRRIATSQLVVADLTDLNPNVFYELGVRHSLRKVGTILIIDKSRSTIPFDLKPYRVIEFTTDLRGIEQLREKLDEFARAVLTSDIAESTDSPVHDFLPSLPNNVFESANESHEGELREEIARLNMQLKRYAPTEATTSDRRGQLDDVLANALAKAKRGELPSDLVDKARASTQAGDKVGFLTAVSQLAADRDWKSVKVSDWLALAQDARELGLPSGIEVSLFERIIELRPADESFESRRLQVLAHSEDPTLRQEARDELGRYFEIQFSEDGQTATIGRHLQPADIATLAVMLDAYRNDGLNHQGLAVTTQLLERFPNNSVVLRNHARALRSSQQDSQALEFYSKSVRAPDVTDTSAAWASTLFRVLDRRIDAIELLALACRLDPDDPDHWLNLADDLADEVGALTATSDAIGRRIPPEFTMETIEQTLRAAFLCRGLQQSHLNDAVSTLRKMTTQLTVSELADLTRIETSQSERPSLYVIGERRDLADRIYRVLATSLTIDQGNDKANSTGQIISARE